MTLAEIILHRRSVRKFDPTYPFDHEAVTRALELSILAPNSSNLQCWEFYRLRDKEKIKQLLPLCLKQNAVRSASELVLFVSRKDQWREHCKWHLDNIQREITAGLGDETRHQKGLRYYGTSIPFLYKSDLIGLYSLIRKINLWVKHLRNKPFLNWTTSSDIRVVSHKSLALAAANFMLSMTEQGYASCPLEGFDEYKVKRFLHLPSKAEISMIIACGKGLPEGIYTERRRIDYNQVVHEL